MKKYLPYLYALVGFATMTLSNGKYLYGLAAFVFPLFLLLATEKMRPRLAIPLLLLITSAANTLSFHNMLPDVGMPILKWLPAMAGATLALPFIAQYLAFRRSTAFSTTLLLPAIYTLLDFGNALFNPFGSFGVLGYSQHNILVVAQLASIVGAVGLTFVIMWFGTAMYWLIRTNNWRRVNRYSSSVAILVVVIFLFGSIRLTYSTAGDTYAVSGLHTLDRTVQETADLFTAFETDPASFLRISEVNIQQVLDMTETEAQNGAAVVSHAEATLVLSAGQKDDVLGRISKLAVKERITIVTTMYVLMEPPKKHENVLYIVGPDGTLLTEHYKYGGNAFEGSVKGSGVIQAATTPSGTLSGIICWDKDFPQIVNQVGRLGVDTLFIPSADWKEISPYHTIVGTFRAIENGSNAVTQTVNGMSMIVDYTGRVITTMDHFTQSTWVMRGDLPVKGRSTLYTHLSPYLLYAVLAALLAGLLGLRRKKDMGDHETGFDL